MRISRAATALTITGVITAGLLTATPALADTTTCAISATIPSTIAYAGISTVVPSKVSDPSGCLDWAGYQLVRSDGTLIGGYVYDAAHPTSNFSLTALSDGAGRYQLTYDTGYSTIATDDVGSTAPLAAAASNWLTAKFASKIAWSPAHRSNGKTSVAVTVKRYAASKFAYVAWKNATVKFQVKRGNEWVTLKTVHSSAKGVAAATITTGVHTWRAISGETATVWGKATGTHQK